MICAKATKAGESILKDPTLLCCGKEIKVKEEEATKAEGTKGIVKGRFDAAAEGGVEGAVCFAGEVTTDPRFAAENELRGQEELSLFPKTTFSLSRGCGNPTRFANLQPGEVVGVGMTPDVAERARGNPEKEGARMLPAYLDYTGRFFRRHCQ